MDFKVAKKLKVMKQWVDDATGEDYEYLPDAIKRLIELVKFYQRHLNTFNFTTDTVETPVIDCTYHTSLYGTFQSIGEKLKIARLKNTQNVKKWNSCFYNCRQVETIETLDFSSAEANGLGSGVFHFTQKLVNLKIVPGTIKWSISFIQSYSLSLESAKGILLALVNHKGTDLEFTMTITLHQDIWDLLEADGETAPGNMTWADYVSSIGWNK